MTSRWTLLACLATALSAAADARAQTRTVFDNARDKMVDEEIVEAGVKNARVIASMRKTPRHGFVSLAQRKYAYFDMALPIGESQTISPPFVVAYMTEALDPQPGDRVLEIGTGSGYQAAVLSSLVDQVYTIEIVTPLGRKAAKTLKRLRYDNVHAKIGDGYQGWPEHAPFDKIIVTCSPERVPPALVKQLKEGGRMVVPAGQRYQQTLYLLKKVDGKMVAESLRATLFVPMTGRAEDTRQVQPDPANPTLRNGGFERAAGKPPAPAGWHYQRQLELVADGHAPVGERYAKFTNAEPGRGCRALQGFAVDGRKVKQLDISLRVRGENIRPGQTTRQLPMVVVTFYDERRATLSQGFVGPWRGTFSWQQESARIAVPVRAREAIL
ncbi:MAG: protein-L-isoaspartate(D-aspartate) O-methyltransferase, partial [Candidatus Nealsonbacteria bacterium]|nr:protein-L-isoaspartate(D-aspartate) O-methyltransferase [Candidatus Nealsonbacteria bacterium]